VLAELDVMTAKARYSRDYQLLPPDINTDGKLWLRQARHPLLEALFRNEGRTEAQRDREPEGQGGPETAPSLGLPATPTASVQRQVVPIDVRLGHAFNLLVITGPNTGGKTVSLKTTGLLCLMAQAGMHIPAGEGSQVPVFSQVLADIGDEQSLEQSLSTFSSHISRIAGILRSADSRSLVLLDELGAGTDPTEGAALGRAILDGLGDIGCRAMVTTHLGDLKTYAFANERAENAAVEFNVETLRPTYRLQIGQFGASNALQIARRLKLPRDLLKRARRYLRRKQRRTPELVKLQQLREEAEKARADALAAQHDATKKRDEYVQQAEKLQRDAEAAARLRDWRTRLQANDAVHLQRFGKAGKVVRVDHKRGVVAVSVGLGQWEVPLEEVLPVEP
jgi:DNA mismatch repair protein MutS2